MRGSLVGLGVAWLGAWGCGGIPQPPAPLALDLPPPETSTLPESGPIGLPASAAFELRAPAVPLPEPRVEWWPRRPIQASVLAIRVLSPPGPPLDDVRMRLANREVVVTRRGGTWIGLGSLPLDSAGVFELDLQFDRAGASEARRVAVRVAGRDYPTARIRISARPSAEPGVDERVARERALVREALATSDAVWHPEQPFGWPRQPPIETSPFGQRRMFEGSVQSRHLGMDLRARRGNPIRAPAAGRVALAGSFVYQGNAVYLDHGLGLFTAYYHMSSITVQTGDMVRPGDLIGRGGSTGRSTAAHLHWAAWIDGSTIDPETLVGLSLDGASSTPGRPRP